LCILWEYDGVGGSCGKEKKLSLNAQRFASEQRVSAVKHINGKGVKTQLRVKADVIFSGKRSGNKRLATSLSL
jgi:hypothetical protein